MKKLQFTLLSLIITICFASCDLLEPETNTDNNVYYAAAKFIHDTSGENIFITEDGVKLIPTEKITVPDAQKDSIFNKQYYISFQIKERTDKILNINLLSMQLMKENKLIEISDDSTIEKYKNEILNISNIWTSGKYLYIVTQIQGTGKVYHNYNLMVNTEKSNDILHLTMRYDNNNDAASYSLQQTMYYNIEKHIKNCKSDTCTILFNYNSGYLEYNNLSLKIATK